MKTVQEYLHILDPDRLVKLYSSRLCENPDFFIQMIPIILEKSGLKLERILKD